MSKFLSQEDADIHQSLSLPPQQTGLNRPSKRRRRSLEDSMPSEDDWPGSEIASAPSSSPGDSPAGAHDFEDEEAEASSASRMLISNLPEEEAKSFDASIPSARANLNALPPLAPWEGEYVCTDILAKIRNTAHKTQETSPWFRVPKNADQNCSPATFRLLLHPAGNESVKSPGPAAYVEVGPPELDAQEAPTADWSYTDAQYYVCVLSFKDWRNSISQRDRFSFCSTSTDRGWHTILDQNKEQMSNYVGPEGEMVFRFGLLPRGIRLCDRGIRQRGLKNLGMTCYLNSLLQCLFHVPAFRAAIFEMTAHIDQKLAAEVEALQASDKAILNEPTLHQLDPQQSCKLSDRNSPGTPPLHTTLLKDLTDAEIEDAYSENGLPKDYRIGNLSIDLSDSSTTARALQKVFLQLNEPTSIDCVDERSNLRTSLDDDAVNCQDLIRSFNWDVQDQFMQHDAQELNRLLCDKLESEMKGGKSDGSIRSLFGGESEMFIECIDVDYKSKRKEVYYDLQLDVRGLPNIEASLKRYIEAETLEGDNAYFADRFGRQAARKGVRFLSCPPVLQFHLKRFTYDLGLMDMVKVNDEFRFPETLDMEPFCPGAGKYNLLGVNVHQGDVHSGHYYAFIRVRSAEGKSAWLRFDDERVCRVDKYAAVDMNYGGHVEELQCPYIGTKAAPTPSRFLQNHSAYILFYIKSANQQELLTCPSPQKLNPGLEIRLKLQESVYARRVATRYLIEKNIQLAFVVDRDIILTRARGIWKHPSSLPARRTEQRMCQMEAMDVWREVGREVEGGVFGEDVKLELCAEGDSKKCNSIGLFYFDYCARKNQMDDFNLAQASGFTPRYCREDEVRPGLCLWSLEFAHTNAPQTIGRNHGYTDVELKPPHRVQTLTLLLTTFATQLQDQSSVIEAHDKSKLCPLKIFDPWSADLFYFGSVNFNQEKTLSDGRRLIGRRLALTWNNSEFRCALVRQGLSNPMVHLLNYMLRGEAGLLSICAHWESRGWFEAAPLRELTSPPMAPYRPLCISFNLRELEGNEKLRSSLGRLPFESARAGADLLDSLKALRLPEEKLHQANAPSVYLGEMTPLQRNEQNVLVLKELLLSASKKFAESPATLLSSLRCTRRVKLVLYDYIALISRSESITGRKVNGSGSSEGMSEIGSCESVTGKSSERASQMITMLLTWPAECLLEVAGVLFGVRPEFLMILDAPPTQSVAITSEAPPRRGKTFELLADETKSREPLTMQNLNSRLISDVLSYHIQRQVTYGYVTPSERFFAKDSDLLETPSIPILLVPRQAATLWKKGSDTMTSFIRVFEGANVLGCLVVELKKTCVMTIKELIALCLGMMSHDDRMTSRLMSPLSVWQSQAVDLVACTPHSLLRLQHTDCLEDHLTALVSLRSPQLRIELPPSFPAEQDDRMILDCFNLDSSGGFFGHPFSVALGKSDTLSDIIQRLPTEAQNSTYYLCPAKSILDHHRLRRSVQPQMKLWPATIGPMKSGDGKTAVSPQCLIIEHTILMGGTGRSEGKSRRQLALNLR